MGITTSNHYIEHELHQRLLQLESTMRSDVITIVAPMYAGIDDIVRTFIEEIDTGETERSPDLSVVLETDGGSIEVVERIADVLRHHYANGEINFIVPNRAMSAGTVLVMCGDNIYIWITTRYLALLTHRFAAKQAATLCLPLGISTSMKS